MDKIKKYLFIVLLVGFWSCEEESSVNKDYVGEWEIYFQGAFENSDCIGELIEDSIANGGSNWGADSFYVNQSPNIVLHKNGRFILRPNCYPDNCMPWNYDIWCFAGNSVDFDNDGFIGGYNKNGIQSPLNRWNSNGRQESIVCHPDDSYGCEFGDWQSNSNTITLIYDYSSLPYNYTFYTSNGDLFFEIDEVWFPSKIVSESESECRRTVRKMVID